MQCLYSPTLLIKINRAQSTSRDIIEHDCYLIQTLFVCWHIDAINMPVSTKNLVQMSYGRILSQFFYQYFSRQWRHGSPPTSGIRRTWARTTSWIRLTARVGTAPWRVRRIRTTPRTGSWHWACGSATWATSSVTTRTRSTFYTRVWFNPENNIN